MHPNVWILLCAQAIAMCGPPVIILVGGIIGTQIAPTPTLATLPAAVMIVGIGSMSIPAAYLMSKIGRKAGFLSAFSIAAFAVFVAAFSVYQKNFVLLCFALFIFGGNMAFVSQFRFAAAESVTKDKVGRAVSILLLGGLIAAYLGPEIGKRGKELIADGQYAGSFLLLGCVYCLGLIILSFYNNIEQATARKDDSSRPLSVIVRAPRFLLAVSAAAVAYAVMTTLMTATPIHMHLNSDFSLEHVTLVIQVHMLGMFFPSLFTGYLVERLGLYRLMLLGILFFELAILFHLLGDFYYNYIFGLFFLGVGWNFLFVSGTTLLTKCYRYSERFKAQAINDCIVFGTMACASLSAGALVHKIGWVPLNLVAFPLLILMLIPLVIVHHSAGFSDS